MSRKRRTIEDPRLSDIREISVEELYGSSLDMGIKCRAVTNEMMDEYKRLCKLAKENGMEDQILPIARDQQPGYAMRRIKALGMALKKAGVDISIKDERYVKCGECQYFKATIGSSGMCPRMHMNKRKEQGCFGGKRK